jgi:FkbM family methyltransferase
LLLIIANVIFASCQIRSCFGYFDSKPIAEGEWEGGISQDIRKSISAAKAQKGNGAPVVVLDIGANLGWFTLLSLSLGAHTISFEPLKYNVELLSNSITANNWCDRAKVYKVALGDHDSSEDLCLKPAYASVAGNLHNGQLNKMPHSAAERAQCLETVPVRKLDSFLLHDGLAQQLDIMKVDVEGYEALAIQGGMSFFRNVVPCVVLLELIPAYVFHSGSTPRKLFAMIFDLGFEYYSGHMHERTPQQVLDWASTFGTNDYAPTGGNPNLVFIHRNHRCTWTNMAFPPQPRYPA